MEVFFKCKNCCQDINVTYNMFERKISNKLILTIVNCPSCNYEMVVQIDNNATLKLFQRQLHLSKKIGKTLYSRGEATPVQKRTQEELSKALLQKREDLVNKYNHTLYQFEGVEHQLDFYAPSVIIGGNNNG